VKKSEEIDGNKETARAGCIAWPIFGRGHLQNGYKNSLCLYTLEKYPSVVEKSVKYSRTDLPNEHSYKLLKTQN
jgi:hypothetical protein